MSGRSPEDAGSFDLVRSILWRSTDKPGTEHASLWRSPEGWRLQGTVVTAYDGTPATARYVVDCDRAWRTRRTEVLFALGGEERTLRLSADGEGRWVGPPDDASRLQGCLDVDLGITPATNTLPIRRLALDVRATTTIEAAWVRFPALDVVRAEQRYTRLSDRTWRYESNSFAADLTVDGDGVVIDYPGGWERVSSGPA